MTQFAQNPNWHAAAQELINQFAELPDIDDRVTLLEKMCERLDGNLYPGFLQILYVIEQHAETTCKRDFVQTVSYGLSTGRLPSGKLPAFGSSQKNANPYGQSRLLGPLEFLCAWYSQSTHLPDLAEDKFSQLCASLVRLFSTEPEAAELYRSKLQSDVLNPVVGSLSSRGKEGVKSLIISWQQPLTPEQISQAVLLACGAPQQGINSFANADPFKPSTFG